MKKGAEEARKEGGREKGGKEGGKEIYSCVGLGCGWVGWSLETGRHSSSIGTSSIRGVSGENKGEAQKRNGKKRTTIGSTEGKVYQETTARRRRLSATGLKWLRRHKVYRTTTVRKGYSYSYG